MKPCDPRWSEALADHALGLPASADLAEHVAKCAVCSEALREWQGRIARVDAGIRELTASEPAPHAAARIMAEVRAQRPQAWMARWEWRMATLCGVAILIASSVYLWKAHGQRIEAEKTFAAASAIGSWKSPTNVLLVSPAGRWLNAPLQLSQYFYPLKTNVPEKEKATP